MANIFISHSSECLTNHKLHGDGLVAYEFIKRLANRGHTLHVATASMDIKGDIPQGIYLYPVSQFTPISTLQPLEYMIKVRQIFNQIRQKYPLDLIHQLNPVSRGKSCLLTNTGLPLILGLFVPGWESNLLPKTPQKPFSFGKIILALTNPIIEKCDRIQQKHATALLLSTPAAQSRLYDTNIQNKIHYLPYGIDTNIFFPQPNQTKEMTILYLASLTQRKGIFTLLDAFEQVVKKFPSCHLKIAGKGEDEEAVKQRIATMSCQNQISLLGMITRDEIPNIMNQCTLYCLPSYGEPFGISALEAMACGKPVVGTDAGGFAYLITEEGGRKVSPNNVPALADALIQILASKNLQISMGNYNRNLIEKIYDWEKIIDKLESIYASIIIGF